MRRTVPGPDGPSDSGGLAIGVAAPVFAAPGVPTFRTPSLTGPDWPTVLEAVQSAEALGYRSAWFSDHMFHGYEGSFLECWTTLSAVAGATDRIRLVTNHWNNGLRHAPLTAKMAATIDMISAGRLELFPSPGMRAREHLSYGFEWDPDIEVRRRKLAEAVTVWRKLWSGTAVDHNGEFYSLAGAICSPVPRQVGGPPIWLGGPMDEAAADLVARSADGWNALPAPVADFARASALVDGACRRIGREPAVLGRSMETQVLVLDDWDEWEDWLDRWAELRRRHPMGEAVSDLLDLQRIVGDRDEITRLCRDNFLVGTVDELIAKLAAYHAAGLSEIVCWFMDLPSTRSMERLAREIIPAVG